jgi:hypothetical protein
MTVGEQSLILSIDTDTIVVEPDATLWREPSLCQQVVNNGGPDRLEEPEVSEGGEAKKVFGAW